jgi:putative transposase
MERRPYPSDLTDAQWEVLQSVLPKPKGGKPGRPRTYPLREIWNAIFYQARTGCQWRYLPHDFPPQADVWEHFCRFRDAGVIEAVHDALRVRVRQAAGRESTASAAILDSQSVKTPQKGGATATTQASRSKGASAISRSIRSD